MSDSRVFSNLSRRKFLQYSSLAATTSVLAACTGGSGGESQADLGENPIKVGVMYSTTGSIAIVEKSLQDATFLAIEQIN
ncbi:MAG: transporter substrate-binding protein, partial [Cyanobacteria bacterium J06649_11]